MHMQRLEKKQERNGNKTNINSRMNSHSQWESDIAHALKLVRCEGARLQEDNHLGGLSLGLILVLHIQQPILASHTFPDQLTSCFVGRTSDIYIRPPGSPEL